MRTLGIGRLAKEGVRCSFADAGEVITPVTSAERYEDLLYNGSIADRHTEAGRRLRSSAYSDERHVALFKTLRRRPAAVPVIAAVSPAGEVDAPCARTRARSAQSRQGWALLFERPSQLEGTGCVRACFRQAQETATHQSCTTPMPYCFQLDVRSLYRRCPGTAVIIAGQLQVADHHVRDEVRPSRLEPGVGLVHV